MKPLLLTILICLISLPVFAQNNELVIRVIDGDTLKLASGEKVRLIGIDTPEMHESKKLHDYKMQQFVYKKQASAYNYMLAVTDKEVKKFAIRQYPNDYSMQKFVYDKQLSAKQYMKNATNSTAKRKAQQDYPYDYSMQKYIYDKFVYGN